MRVLVVTPVHNRLYLETLRSIYALRVPSGVQVDMFSPWEGYPDDSSYVNIATKYEEARSFAVHNRYDYILTIESDMIVPANALIELLQADCDVAYGTYTFRRAPYAFSAYVVMEQGVGYPMTINPTLANEFLREGLTVDTDGVGLGCTLISSRVFSTVAFREGEPIHPGEDGVKLQSHCDWYFALDTKDDYKCRAVGSVKCGHITEHGYTIYPSPTDKAIIPSHFARFVPDAMLQEYVGVPDIDKMNIHELYAEALCTPSDMQEHLPFLCNNARGNVVELGTRYGTSTLAFLASPHTRMVTSYDVEYQDCLRRLQYSPKWEFRQQDTRETDYDGVVNTLLVDSEHTYEQVTSELEHWLPRMSDAGVVFFHDVNIPEVHHAIRQYFNTYTIQPSQYPLGVAHMSDRSY